MKILNLIPKEPWTPTKASLRPEVLRPIPRSSLDQDRVEIRTQKLVYSVNHFCISFWIVVRRGQSFISNSRPSHCSTQTYYQIFRSVLLKRFLAEFPSDVIERKTIYLELGEEGGSTMLRMAPSNLVEWAFFLCIRMEFLQVQQYLSTAIGHAH